MYGYICLCLLVLWLGWWTLDESSGDESGDRWLLATGLALFGAFAFLPVFM